MTLFRESTDEVAQFKVAPSPLPAAILVQLR